MRMIRKISAELATRLINYDPITGEMFWRARTPDVFDGNEGVCVRWNSRFANKKAFDSLDANGYRVAMILGQTVKGHRVAWAIRTGQWPDGLLDHIDGNRGNNAACNLRSATPAQNGRNRKSAKNSSSRYLGVSWVDRRKRWQASISLSGQKKTIGYFKSEDDAAKAYDAWAVAHHGQFANPNFVVV